jgi:hypothetical protein
LCWVFPFEQVINRGYGILGIAKSVIVKLQGLCPFHSLAEAKILVELLAILVINFDWSEFLC